jgi:hypothetical protein
MTNWIKVAKQNSTYHAGHSRHGRSRKVPNITPANGIQWKKPKKEKSIANAVADSAQLAGGRD